MTQILSLLGFSACCACLARRLNRVAKTTLANADDIYLNDALFERFAGRK